MREFQFRIRVDRDKSNLEFDCKLEIEEKVHGTWKMGNVVSQKQKKCHCTLGFVSILAYNMISGGSAV